MMCDDGRLAGSNMRCDSQSHVTTAQSNSRIPCLTTFDPSTNIPLLVYTHTRNDRKILEPYICADITQRYGYLQTYISFDVGTKKKKHYKCVYIQIDKQIDNMHISNLFHLYMKILSCLCSKFPALMCLLKHSFLVA